MNMRDDCVCHTCSTNMFVIPVLYSVNATLDSGVDVEAVAFDFKTVATTTNTAAPRHESVALMLRRHGRFAA